MLKPPTKDPELPYLRENSALSGLGSLDEIDSDDNDMISVEITLVEESTAIGQIIDELLSLKQNSRNLAGLIKMNNYITRFVENFARAMEPNVVLSIIDCHIDKIDKGTFNWIYETSSLSTIKKFVSIVNHLDEDKHYKFLNYEKLREVMPIRFFLAYLSKPFSANEEDAVTYDQITSFHSTLLSAFMKLYFRSFMTLRPSIESAMIYSIDPFMRNEYRKQNLQFYIQNFWNDDNFEIYSFIEKMIESYALAGLPKWQITEGPPLLIPLLEFIDFLFIYGLVSYMFCKPLLRYLYLISETMRSIEIKTESMKNDKTLVDKSKAEFIKCREYMSSILVNVFILFCDVALEESILEHKAAKADVHYFKSFLLADRGSYNYFCSIVIKYLSSYIDIDGPLSSEVVDSNLTLIYNFIGDFQKDSFVLSAELVSPTYFDFYMSLIENKNRRTKDHMTANEILDDVISLIKVIRTSVEDLDKKNFIDLITRITVLIDDHITFDHFSLELSTLNFVPLWLSVIELLSDTDDLELIDNSMSILETVLYDNYPGQSVLFRGEGYKSFLNIMTKHMFTSLVMLRRIFDKDASLLYLSQDMFCLNLDIYKQKLDDIIEELRKVPDQYPSSRDIPDLSAKLTILFYFNLYFNCLLEDKNVRFNRRKHYDTILANYLEQFITEFVIPGLTKTENPDSVGDLKLTPEISDPSINQRLKILKLFADLNCEKIIFKFFYSTLKLFNKATYKIYYGEVWTSVTNALKQVDINSLRHDYSQSILIRLEFVKLFERFEVFYNNHMITNRAKNNPHAHLYLGEKYIPENYEKITKFIIDEFDWFEKYIAANSALSEDDTHNIKNYLYKGVLPLIYKFLKALNYHISKMLEDSLIEELKNTVDIIIGELRTILPFLKKFTEKPASVAKSQTFDNPLKNLFKISAKNGFVKLSGNRIKPVIDEKSDTTDNLEERINPNLKIMRTVLSEGISYLDNIYRDSGYEYIVSRYVREPIEETTRYMKKVLKSSESVRKKLISRKTRHDKIKAFSEQADAVWRTIMYEYGQVKLSYQDNKDTNQFYMVLSGIKDHKQNLKNIIQYFINHFEQSTCIPSNADYKTFYLNNEFFFSCIIILDNLNIWNKKVKKVLVKLLEKMSFERRNKILNNIWGVYISLYLIVLFKTFMDDEWEMFWSLFYIVSMFWQNLCEESSPKFKLFLNNKDKAYGALGSFTSKNYNQAGSNIFFENYVMLESSANFTDFWLNYTPKIVPSDRAELLPVFKRLFTQVTEYLNGPCAMNQKRIYTYRIDLWNGIINRIVDDIDSKFYEVKLACLLYIQALLEGLDNDIVTFMGSNLQINKLFTMIVRLTKKLYIRHLLHNQRVRKVDKIQNNIKNVLVDLLRFQTSIKKSGIDSNDNSEITKDLEDKYQIDSYQELIRMYKKFTSSFSEHVVLNVVITTYVMLVNMSFKLKFYEFFLKEKEKESSLYLNKKAKFDNEKFDEIIIYLFLQNITANIEIIYETDNQVELKRLYYRIPAECMFLTTDMMDEFLQNVSYGSTQSKHIDLFDEVEKFQIEMKNNKRYYEKYGGLYKITTTDFYTYNQILLYIMSLVLNVIMLVYLGSKNVTSKTLAASDVSGDIVIKVIAFFIAIYSGILSILWLMFKYNIEVAMATSYFLRYHNTIKRTNQLKIRFFSSLLIHPRFISFYLHMIFTVLGLATNNPFFYTLNLFLLTNMFKTVNYIMKSIFKHYDKLIITFILTILVIFCYSFILLENFSSNINDNDYDNNVCVDFLHCFLNSVNLGLRLGGGVSDAFYLIGRLNAGGLFYGRFFFDLTFFILIKLIFLNLIAGIIIDTFSDMRDELTQRGYTLQNICFICGKTRWQLEKDGIKFDVHIGKDHSLWKYLYFMIRLRSINPAGLNGAEKYIHEKLRKDDSSWIPQNLYLKGNVNFVKLRGKDLEGQQ